MCMSSSRDDNIKSGLIDVDYVGSTVHLQRPIGWMYHLYTSLSLL
jgi:hypothetical protein